MQSLCSCVCNREETLKKKKKIIVMIKRNESQEGRQGVQAGCDCVCNCVHALACSEATSHGASIKTLALRRYGKFLKGFEQTTFLKGSLWLLNIYFQKAMELGGVY